MNSILVQRVRYVALVLIPAMLAGYGVTAYQLRTQLRDGYSDFISAYTAAKVLQRGAGDSLYDLPLQHEIQRQAAPRVSIRQGALPYVRPPFAAWMYRPLAQVPYAAAFAIWSAISLLALVGALALLREQVAPMQELPLWLATLAALSFFPVFQTLLQGQDSILLLLVYSLTYVALRQRRDLLAGLCLALGTFKFPLVVPFALIVASTGRIRFAAGFLLASVALASVSLAMVGWAGLVHYPAYLASIDRFAPGVNVVRNMPTVRGVFALISGSPPDSMAGVALLAAASVALLVTVAKVWARENSDLAAWLPLGFSLSTVATVLVSFHAHIYDLTLLILPMILLGGVLFSSVTLSATTRRLLVGALALVAFSPLYIVLWMGVRGAVLATLLAALGLVILRIMSELKLQAALGDSSPEGSSA